MPTRTDRRPQDAADDRRTSTAVVCPGQYAWLPAALSAYAATREGRYVKRSTSKDLDKLVLRDLVLRGLKRGTGKLWPLRPVTSTGRAPRLPQYTYSGEYLEIPRLVTEATEAMRERLWQRYQAAVVELAPKIARAGMVDVYHTEIDGVPAIYVYAKSSELSRLSRLIDHATAYPTKDLAEADLVREVVARELKDYAPRGWNEARDVADLGAWWEAK